MARDFAISYGSKIRPAAQPASGFRETRPEKHAVSRDRNIERVNPTPTHAPKPDVTVCTVTTKAGTTCKARPVEGTGACIFHTERPT
jgi:hypothetical protein